MTIGFVSPVGLVGFPGSGRAGLWFEQAEALEQVLAQGAAEPECSSGTAGEQGGIAEVF